MVEEYLDVVDENDNVVGCERRDLIHRLGLLHRGTHVFLFNSEGQLLVQRRQGNCESWPLALDCSVSEHVKSGENFHDAAVRGLEEELGITAMKLRPVIKFILSYGETDKMISILFQGTVDPRTVQMNIGEIEGIDYRNPSECVQMIDDGEDIFSRWFIQLLFWYSGRLSDLGIVTRYNERNPH